ncbi:MAG: zinc ABC transporter substrate-binding protein [Ktedonobacterales bacterium]|nr:zinc ABC transporter substrate-binding protein [Ktedonobacterales bacterium]
MRRLGLSVTLLVSCLLSACGTTAPAPAPGGGSVIQVVTAENFWGSIAAQVGGSHVHVTNIIASPAADPHDYEYTAQDARTVSDAQYVIINGAGYDPWAEKLLAASPMSGRQILNVGTFLGKHVGDNPHLWYNPDYVTAVAMKIRDDLTARDPHDASAIAQTAQRFLTSDLQAYHSLITDIKARFGGTPVGATESIFAYLAPALGLNLITPPSYLKAVSEGADISAGDEATVEEQIKLHQIKVLIYNSQNTPNNITAVINLAKAQGIPVATITETLTPAGATYQAWQATQLSSIQAALAKATGK